MKTTHTIAMLALLASVTFTSTFTLRADALEDVGISTIVGGESTGVVPQQINDNGRNAWVISDGQGSGVIFQDKGPTYIQKIGGTTFIVPTSNQNRRRNCNESR